MVDPFLFQGVAVPCRNSTTDRRRPSNPANVARVPLADQPQEQAMTRSVLLAALLALALGGAPLAQAQQWIDHRPAGGGYRVAFPAQPIEQGRTVDTDVGKVTMQTSAVEIDGKIFMTIDSIYPSEFKMGDAEATLDTARNGGLRNVGGRLLSEERLNIDNAPARRLVIDIPHSNQAAEALMVLDGHRLYQAVYLGPRGSQKTEDANRFLSSFKLER
jgi:hypothetical protein